MQEKDRLITESYNLTVKSIVPFKEVFIMNTAEGKKILKKTLFQPERILFIHGLKEHLYANRFKNIDRYICTTDGSPFITLEGANYTLTDLIEGSECDFDSRSDIIRAARLLASMHKASRGYSPPENSIPRDDLGKLPSYLTKRLEEIRKLKKAAKKGRTRFDYMFLDCVDYFISLGENAIDSINRSKYGELVKLSREQGIVCHHDYTHHNILFNGNEAYVVNFDFCCFELKVYDMANLIRRKMRKCDWNIQEAGVIFKEYCTIEPVSGDEFLIMKYILQFPQKFWRVVNKYYNSKRSWSEKSYISKLQEVTDEVESHKQFLEKFETLY